MIGKAYISTFKFYDAQNKKMSFKGRPVLIVGQSDATDYVVLPISRVTNSIYIDSDYDVQITQQSVPLMALTQTSYIRTHKQEVVNAGELTKEIIDFRKEYPDIYLDVLAKMERFQKGIIDQAL